MNRTTAREIAMHLVFEMTFTGVPAGELLERELDRESFALRAETEPLYGEFPDRGSLEYIARVVTGVEEHGAELEEAISRYARGWRLKRIDRVAAAILRVCLYEILYLPDVPDSAAINEAVEIAKGYVDDDVVKFINGILGSFVRDRTPGPEDEG